MATITMTAKEAAATLDGSEYREEGCNLLWQEMKTAGLVAVFGASDDLMEFRGAINDEADCYGGGLVKITRAGFPSSKCGEGDDCPYFKAEVKDCPTIEAVWDEGGFSWLYRTEIPHETFIVKEDGEPYCRGIVFSLADLPA